MGSLEITSAEYFYIVSFQVVFYFVSFSPFPRRQLIQCFKPNFV